MSEQKKNTRDAELDAFWDIDALIPAKKAPHMPHDTTAAEIVIEPQVPPTQTREEPIPQPSDAPKRHFIPPHTAEGERRPAADEEYTPDNALIRRVRLFRWRSDYRYYEGFVRDAVRLCEVRGGACPRVPFFSYVPQYSQMSRPQLEWYLYWRDAVRKGEYPDTDYSYILLYVYELINLSDRIDPKKLQATLCGIWTRYRELYHQLDSYLPEWICDHSLIHHLPPPAVCTGELLPAVMSHCTLKEFYLPGGGNEGYLNALLAFCSNYDYRKSKFYSKENIPLFDRTVMGALREIVRLTGGEDGRLFSASGMEDSRLVRDAYTGALCSYRIKRKIEVEYCSFSRSHELRYLITDVVKYTENRLRAALGIRSRLSIYAIPVPLREGLDAYFLQTLPVRKTPKAREEEERVAAYERLYELPKRAFSAKDAAEIEQASWQTTKRLVEAFETEAEDCVAEKTVAQSVPQPAKEAASAGGAWTRYLPFLRAAMAGDSTEQRRIAASMGVACEVLADDINGLAAELLGDILLEETDGGFSVIEDYRETVAELEGK